MSDSSKLFRQAALEKLSSPEQLDVAMEVTAPAGWIALWAMGAVLVSVLIWSVAGKISDTVAGQGILIRGQSVLDVSSATTGRLLEVTCGVGDDIRKGQLIARIDQPDLRLRIENTRSTLSELIERNALQLAAEDHNYSKTIQAFNAERNSLDNLEIIRLNKEEALRALQEERESVQASIGDYQEQVEALSQQVSAEEELVAEGLLARNAILSTREKLASARQAVSRNRVRLAQILTEETSHNREWQQAKASNEVRLAQIGSEESALDRQLQQQRAARLSEIEQNRRQLNDLETTHKIKSEILSPYDGRVLEVMAAEGSLVDPGTRVVILEAQTETLEAFIYIGAGEGKKVKPGMQVRISPSTVKVEEYGYIFGEVKSVSEFPVTPEGVLYVLRNENLARSLTAEAPPIEIVASLTLDPNTPSGYNWSSSVGPPSGVFSGTLCSAGVVVDRKRPISYVFPIFKKAVGAY